MKIYAYQVGESLNLKEIKKNFTAQFIRGGLYDLFYKTEEEKYILLLDYGSAVFAGMDEIERSKTLSYLKTFAIEPLDEIIGEELELIKTQKGFYFNFDAVKVPDINEDILFVVMYLVGQSAALDYYSVITEKLLESTTEITKKLEAKGTFDIDRRKLLKFVGKSMNLRNKIIDNIYPLNDHEIVWEDESLSKLNQGLKDFFEIRSRFRQIDYQLQIIMDNLRLFADLIENRVSNRLEWIIIILIFVEVLHLFAREIFPKIF